MDEPVETRCEELEELQALAQSEIEAATSRVEDTLLLGRVAEAIAEEEVEERIFGKLLESVSVLRDVPYAALFELDTGEPAVRAEHAALAAARPSGARLVLPDQVRDAILNQDDPTCAVTWDLPPGCLTFATAGIEISAILAVSCAIRSRPPGVLLLADERRDSPGLRALLPVVHKAVRIVQNRLEQLEQRGELSDINRVLERVADGRTAPLARLSRAIEREVAGRREAQASLRRAAAALENTSEGVSFVDEAGLIVAVNRAFTEVTGFEADEVIGKTSRILQSGRHDSAFYDAMWRQIRETGRWRGEVWNRRKDGVVYPALLNVSEVRDEADTVTHYVGVLSDLSVLKESAARFDHLVHYDALTELPNRLLFRARVEYAIAQVQGRRLALLVLGVDGFKHLNESLGHSVGDELLRQVGARLQGLNRRSSTIARPGGDEFCVLLDGVVGPEGAGRAAWNMLEGIVRPFEVQGREVFLTCSAGISLFPDDGGDFTTLLQNAEAALHRAKGLGGNTYQFYTPEMTERAFERFLIESDLRRAIQRRELALSFQPQFSLDTGELTGVEALARWNHPNRGTVAPQSFIPIAEESGLIYGLGDWAIREACQQAVAWQAEGLPPLRVAVNLSSRQIASPHLVDSVAKVLHEEGLAADRLELEITEGFLASQPETARETLHQLKDLGVTLAIDDFGTGYSSLSYLKIYPVDRLKIDKSFVDAIPFRPDDQAIARAIITLGHGLSLKIVAEGVETQEQAEFLRASCCDEVQGYYFGRPMPATELSGFLRERATG